MKPIHYTKIPDYFIDQLMPILTGSEFKILIYIARKTIGWNKERDRISHRQFLKTGVKPRSISRAIASLEAKNLIEITDQKGNILYPQNRKQNAQIYYSCGQSIAKMAMAIAKNDTKSLPKWRITIDTNNKQEKENPTRKKSDAERLLEILQSNT